MSKLDRYPPRGVNNLAQTTKHTSFGVGMPKRFKSINPDNYGVDPHGAYTSFLVKDPITNLDPWRDSRTKPANLDLAYPYMKERVPVGTTTYSFTTGKQMQNGKLNRENISIKYLPKNKTDCISCDPPTSDRPQQKVYNLMLTQPKYGNNMMSQQPWMPYDNIADEKQQRSKTINDEIKNLELLQQKQNFHVNVPSKAPSRQYIMSEEMKQSKTLGNRSSMTHNIISGENNAYSAVKVPGLLDGSINNRRKGITEIKDLQGANSMNWNPDYTKVWNENNDSFKRRNGVFTHLYDAAARFGESQVFKH